MHGGTLMNELPQLASLLKSRNTIDHKIASLIGHPTQVQSVGEYIASVIFGITLSELTTNKNSDGRFTRGPLQGHTVDVQWYPRREGILHLKTDPLPDYYLILAGSKEATNLHTLSIPWVIEAVYLFDSGELLTALRERGVLIGKGTSITSPLWERAEIYPTQRNTRLVLSPEERDMLALFR
jgi:hypothetical protein